MPSRPRLGSTSSRSASRRTASGGSSISPVVRGSCVNLSACETCRRSSNPAPERGAAGVAEAAPCVLREAPEREADEMRWVTFVAATLALVPLTANAAEPAEAKITAWCVAKWQQGSKGTFACDAVDADKKKIPVTKDRFYLEKLCTNDARLKKY